MRILAVSFSSREGEVAGNVARVVALIRDFCCVQPQPVDLVLLPEMFTCGYCALDLSPWAEDEDSPTFQAFRDLAEEFDVLVGWGYAGRVQPGKAYNCYALLEPGRQPALVRKTHLHISRPGTRENEPEYLLPGDDLGLVDTRLGRLGVMICYDGCFIEVPRSLVLSGAQVILWPARSGGYLADTGFPRIRSLDNIVPIVLCEGA